MTDVPDLRQTQRLLLHGIDPLSAAEQAAQAAVHIDSTAGLTAQRRFSIYRQSITSTRVRALEAIYPVCRRVLGEQCFSAVLTPFVWRTADAAPDLNAYGAGLAEALQHLTAAEPVFRDYPYLPDLARLEWSLHAAYYAADEPAFDPAQLQDRAAEQVTIRLAHGVSVHVTDFPVFEIWRQHQQAAAPGRVAYLQGPDYLCVYRDGQQPAVAQLQAREHALLSACRGGIGLATLAAAEGVSADLATRLPALIARGWLVAAACSV